MMSAAHGAIGTAPPRQEWNTRWIAILVGTALVAGAAGYAAGGGPSKVSALTGTAMAGIGQISVQAQDGMYYAIPLDFVDWVDSKGVIHDRGRAECLPPDTQSRSVKFLAVEWTLDGVTRRNVVWVNCRN